MHISMNFRISALLRSHLLHSVQCPSEIFLKLHDGLNHIGDLNKYSTKIDHFFPSLYFHFFIFFAKKLKNGKVGMEKSCQFWLNIYLGLQYDS